MPRERFVEKQHAGFVDQGLGQLDPLPHAFRIAANRAAHVLRHADPGDGLFGGRGRLRAGPCPSAARRCGRSPVRTSTHRRRPARGRGRCAASARRCSRSDGRARGPAPGWGEAARWPVASMVDLPAPLGPSRPVTPGAIRTRQLVQADHVAVPLGDPVELDDGVHRRRSSDFTRVLKMHRESPKRPARTAADQVQGYCGTIFSARRRSLAGSGLSVSVQAPGDMPDIDSTWARRRSKVAADLHPGGIRVRALPRPADGDWPCRRTAAANRSSAIPLSACWIPAGAAASRFLAAWERRLLRGGPCGMGSLRGVVFSASGKSFSSAPGTGPQVPHAFGACEVRAGAVNRLFLAQCDP